MGFCFFSSLLPTLHSRERNCRGQWRPCPTLPSCSWAYWRREDVVSKEWLGRCEICKVWSTTFICREFSRIDTGYIACFLSFNPCRIPDSLPYRGENRSLAVKLDKALTWYFYLLLMPSAFDSPLGKMFNCQFWYQVLFHIYYDLLEVVLCCWSRRYRAGSQSHHNRTSRKQALDTSLAFTFFIFKIRVN